jgi:2-amino-4-hydroxy-6-hydroxymethyldihydropteridine diphosphokinase
MSETINETVFLALGSNLGNREDYILRAIEHIKKMACSTMIKSSIYQTPPVGPGTQNHYLNMCVLLQTSLEAREILDLCQRTEKLLGRQHNIKWGPREIDVDILLYGSHIINAPDMVIPHPEMQNRQFVLVPLAEIAPDYIVPSFNLTVSQLLEKHLALHGPEKIIPYLTDTHAR